MPMYPGGNNSLVSYVAKHIKYPSSDMENGVQGKVITKLCVTAKGGFSMISVLKSVDPALDAEAIKRNVIDKILPLDQIAQFIQKFDKTKDENN